MKRKACCNESSPSYRHQRLGSLPAQRPDTCVMPLEGQVKRVLGDAADAVKSRPIPDWMNQIGTPTLIQLRRLEDGDSVEHLTDLLHRAFSRIGAMGIPCSCLRQPSEVTRQRISPGECFVALSGDLIVGTVTLYPAGTASDSEHYRNHQVGTLHQLAVDPLFHGKGIGKALLRLAESWAFHRGYRWLALDTPEPANHLIDYYQRQGFSIKETLQFAGRPYRSVVFSKSVADHKIADRRPHALGGPPFIRPIQCATANAFATP